MSVTGVLPVSLLRDETSALTQTVSTRLVGRVVTLRPQSSPATLETPQVTPTPTPTPTPQSQSQSPTQSRPKPPQGGTRRSYSTSPATVVDHVPGTGRRGQWGSRRRERRITPNLGPQTRPPESRPLPTQFAPVSTVRSRWWAPRTRVSHQTSGCRPGCRPRGLFASTPRRGSSGCTTWADPGGTPKGTLWEIPHAVTSQVHTPYSLCGPAPPNTTLAARLRSALTPEVFRPPVALGPTPLSRVVPTTPHG